MKSIFFQQNGLFDLYRQHFQSHRSIAEAHLAQENFQVREVVNEVQRLNVIISSQEVMHCKIGFNVLQEKVMLRCELFGIQRI